MINFEITAHPAIGKKTELEQSIASIREKIITVSPSFEIVYDQIDGYKFIFQFDTKKEAQTVFKSEGFILIAGAIKTLCNEANISLNGKQIQLKEINHGSISNNREYKILTNNL